MLKWIPASAGMTARESRPWIHATIGWSAVAGRFRAGDSRPGIAPYTASKGAVANLTKGMATDWARYGLNVNAIAPGYFDTPLNAALVADPEFNAWLARRTPQGRWGRLPELAGACIFLASAASIFVNGHTLFVDGGITASL